MPIAHRLVAALVWCAMPPSLAGCNAHPLVKVNLEPQGEVLKTVPVTVNRDVDILFVIDDSGSMGEEQATLARNFGAFIETLEDPKVDANYRIAITTTDAGHLVEDDTTTDAGRFQLRSCLDREADFTSRVDGEDYFAQACSDVCNHPGLQTTPTTTLYDDTPTSRKWIERSGEMTNLPAGVTAAEAFACFGPQGVAGVGFESQLESMRLALARAQTESDEAYGFLRPKALLAVVFVTDEADCSANQDPSFAPAWTLGDGAEVFWSTENIANNRRTSEICWNAGVQCEGGPGTYTNCTSVDLDIDGQPTDDPSRSVLHPVSRYTEFLEALEATKQEGNSSTTDILVSVIGGVPEGYDEGLAELTYSDSSDPELQLAYGIGAGCSSSNGVGIPPVRMREFAEAFEVDRRNLYSVCEPNYTGALQAIADEIKTQLRPPCVETCVGDSDPTTVELEPQCTVKERIDQGSETETVDVPQCERDKGSIVIPPNADTCWRPLTNDEMSPTCKLEGWNLELKLERRDGVPEPTGSSLLATCATSQAKLVDCPGLPE